MPLFSIIVPVFNSEQYIEKCIDSILKQTFSDFEIVIVNDGSTDSSLEICQEIAKKDKRIRVFTQKNMGASAARNLGLKKATGDYVQFVDADDTITVDCLESIARLVQQYNNPDVIEYRLRYISPKGDEKILGTTLQPGVYERSFIQDSFLPVHLFCKEDTALYYNIYNVLRFIRRELLEAKNLHFNSKIRRWEDWLFAIKVFNSANNMVVTQDVLYNYIGHEEGGLGGRYNAETYKYVIEALREIDSEFMSKYEMNGEYCLCKKIEWFDRCAKEIYDHEPFRMKKRKIIELISNPYIATILGKCKTGSGIGKVHTFVKHEKWFLAFAVICVIFRFRHIKQWCMSFRR